LEPARGRLKQVMALLDRVDPHRRFSSDPSKPVYDLVEAQMYLLRLRQWRELKECLSENCEKAPQPELLRKERGD